MSFNKINQAFIFCILNIALLACSDEFVVDSYFNKKLTVSCAVKSGGHIELYLGSNAPFNYIIPPGESFFSSTMINDAFITVYNNNRLIDTMIFDNNWGSYKSTKLAEAGLTYKIVINHNLYPQTTALVNVPLPVNVDSVSYKLFADSSNMLLTVFFTDTNIDNNYYTLSFYETKKNYSSVTFYNTDPVFGKKIEFDFSSFAFENDIEAQIKVEIADSIFNNPVISYQCIVPFSSGIFGGGNTISMADTLGVRLYSISQSIFEYNQSLNNYIENQKSGISSQLYTNIENGNGMAGGYSQTTFEFVLR